MTDDTIPQVIEEHVALIRARWNNLGVLDEGSGAFATGHTPSVAPQAYLCRFYAGLSDAALADAEQESERHLPPPYRAFLKAYNGAHIMGISLHGLTGGQNLRDVGNSVGQPVSLRYQNVFYLRKGYIPEGHFAIGTMNGDADAQGHLYLTSTGEVALINSEFDLTAATWPSLSAFLSDEVPRQMTRYDDAGVTVQGVSRLPGDTENWAALGAGAAAARRRGGSLLRRVADKLGEWGKS